MRGTASEVRSVSRSITRSPDTTASSRIDLPAGSYLPDFHVPPEPVRGVPSKAASRTLPRRDLWLGGMIVVALLLAVILARPGRAPKTVIDHFWGAHSQSAGPVLSCVGQPRRRIPSRLPEAEMQQTNACRPGERPGAAAMNQIEHQRGAGRSELGPLCTAIGDAICLSDMAGLLAQWGQRYTFAGRLHELCRPAETPAVPSGAFTDDLDFASYRRNCASPSN